MAPVAEHPRSIVAEGVGTMLLVAAVVGSGIMAERLGAPVPLALLANTLATGAVLVALIVALAPVSGAHFNPAVTLAAAWAGATRWRAVPALVLAQLAGAFAGTAIAHAMFDLPLFAASQHVRCGASQCLAEFIATAGLLVVIGGSGRSPLAPLAVACWIVAAYWFTASTSFANPAVTLARAASDTFAGIRPCDAPAFIGAQLFGALAGASLWRWLAGSRSVPEQSP